MLHVHVAINLLIYNVIMHCMSSSFPFTVTAMNDWVPNWKSNGWKTASGGDVVNRRDFQDLERASEGMDVRYVCILLCVCLSLKFSLENASVPGVDCLFD